VGLLGVVLVAAALPARAAVSGDVRATAETQPVLSASDAADDAAIWRHPTDPGLSLVIGTDKSGGAIEVYDLSGSRVQRITGARANGVDLRAGFVLGGNPVDLVAVGGDDVRFFRVDVERRRLEPVGIGRNGSRVDPNGLCLYRSSQSGKMYLFGIGLQSEVEQLELVDAGAGIDLVRVRGPWDLGHDAEACVADDELGRLYVNEADFDIWRYGAEPDAGTGSADRRSVDRVGQGGHLAADVEGLTLVYQPNGTGYLLASSQGDDSFTVYRREGDNAFIRKFQVESTSKVDGCTNTDGIDALAADLGPAFPHGVFICQDHHNSAPVGGNQNFKLVPLEQVVDLAAAGSVPPAASPLLPPPPEAPGATPPGSDSSTGEGPSAPSPAGAGSGYWLVDASGRVYAFGEATHRGDATDRLRDGVRAADLESHPSGSGYWVLDERGGVHPFGAARHLGDLRAAGLRPGERAASLSASPSGHGYMIFTSAGRAVPFGDAGFAGDLSGLRLNGPVVDSVNTPSGNGYYMVASDGGIFSFGDARFFGSMGGIRLNAPVRSLVPDGDGTGYWLVASDGGVFAFDASFRGSMGAVRLNQPVTGMVRFGSGYLMVAADGGIFNFSDRPFSGSLGDKPPAHPVVSVTALAR
jgi:3-phytase